jgi:DnaJ-class molecular chaperone
MQAWNGGLALTNQEAEHLNKLKGYLKHIEFEKLNPNAQYCPDCKGTGLYNVCRGRTGITFWDGLYCLRCQGLGYLGYNDPCITVCPICKGDLNLDKTCSACMGIGLVDWITNIKLNFGIKE